MDNKKIAVALLKIAKKLIDDVSEDELALLFEIQGIAPDCLLRKFLSSKEIRIANKLFKKKLLEKGMSNERGSCVMFYLSKLGKEFLDNVVSEK